MPKSKRDKEVSLTKVAKKGRALKEKLVDDIRKCIDIYERIFVFSIDNIRNTNIKDLRITFRDSRFFFGRNKVMALAFGRIPEEEYLDDLHKLSGKLTGQCTIMFTNRSVEEVTKYFKNYKLPEFARSGNVASETVELEKGTLEYFPHSMEPLLRKLGLPVVLQKGVIALNEDFVVCNKGDKLTPEQAKILKLFQMKISEFKANLLCVWSKDEKFKLLDKRKEKKSNKSAVMDVDA